MGMNVDQETREATAGVDYFHSHPSFVLSVVWTWAYVSASSKEAGVQRSGHR